MTRRTDPAQMRAASNAAVRMIASRMGIGVDDVAIAAAPMGAQGGFVLDNLRSAPQRRR